MLSADQVVGIIRDARLIPDDALDDAAAAARAANRPLEEILIERKLAAEPALYGAFAARLGVPYVDPRQRTIEPEVAGRIPPALAAARQVVAYEETPTELRVAMADPDDRETIELVSRAVGRTVIPALASPAAITEILRLSHADVESAVAEIAQLSVQPEQRGDERSDRDLQRLAEDIPVVRIVDTLLQHAISLRASDIHIEPDERGVAVRYRIDGVLRPTMTLPRSVAPGLVARIKILANLKIDEHRLPQDGRFKVTTPTERLAIRVAIMPVYDGEKVVLRLLREEGKTLTLADLGLRNRGAGDAPSPLAIVERNIRKPHGIIFDTGPTGSGKTTTLYAMMNLLNAPGVNIATVEDPIEYRIPGVNQSQVQPRIGFTFAAGLRALLRQDPNIIMVGEIRDAETADIAVNAALTGHLVLTTLHTNDAPTALTRLQEMGVPTFLVASTINAVVAQRLVRKLCPSCRKPTALPADLRVKLTERGEELTRALGYANALAAPSAPAEREDAVARRPRGGAREQPRSDAPLTLDTIRVWAAAGCGECRSEGYRGRIGIYEVLEVTPTIAERIHERATDDVLRAAAIAEGMATMFMDGITKAIEGVTTVEEVLRVTRE